MNKLISILGAGESGVGAAILAKQKGFDVFVSDMGEIKTKYISELEKHNIKFESGKHSEDVILSSSEIIKSPGIPDKAPIIKKAFEKNIPIISEIEFAARYTDAKIIAITGSNGKTTTTLLTYHILKNAGLNVGLAGNVGDSFAKQVAENNFEFYVLELSSFQLDGILEFRPNVAVLLNITADHLDRYDYKFENYVRSKMRIALNQQTSDNFIYWDGDENIIKNLSDVKAKKMPFNLDFKISNLKLQGKHNKLNAAAAFIAAKTIGLSNNTIEKAISTFEPVKHRLQKIAVINGVEYINDSKATNVDSVFYALDGIEKPIWWIVGGVDKGNDYVPLFPYLPKIKGVIGLGKDNSKLKDIFSSKVPVFEDTKSMQEAVEKASIYAQSGDVVLLSPACASFDLFNNYEHRGDEFINEIEKLKMEIRK